MSEERTSYKSANEMRSLIPFLVSITLSLIFVLLGEMAMPRREATFQGHLISKLNLLVGMDGYVLNLDGNYIQGFPDILILYKGRWAALECKRSADEPYQPNQEYYLQHLNELAWASVIHPDIEEEVINDLQQALRIR